LVRSDWTIPVATQRFDAELTGQVTEPRIVMVAARTPKNIAWSLTTGYTPLVHLTDQLPMPTPIKYDFEVVRRNKVYEDVAKQIERQILKKLKPGDKLPSERELAEMLQVSRSSIRDAIRGLELMGLVEPRQGAGTIVRGLSAESLLNPFANALKHRQELVGELLDFRKMLEPPLAARAATHASPDEISEMEEILQRQEEKLSDGEAAIAEDAEFHYSVALASGNSVVLKLIDMVMDLLRDTRERSLQLLGRPQKSLAGHRRILAAIKRHDAEAAKAAMRRHIEDIEEIVIDKL
jgi:GntR family transcriptional repressor for pyruvate dehydrogenase complex